MRRDRDKRLASRLLAVPWVLVLVLALLLVSQHVSAQAPAAAAPPQAATAPAAGSGPAAQPWVERARELFEQGVAASKQGLWAEAVHAFEQADALMERPSIVFNLASALLRVGRYADSEQQLHRYLRIAESDDPAQPEATRLQEQLRKQLAKLTLSIAPEGAQLSVDGKPVAGNGPHRALSLDPGEHSLVVSADGYQPQTLSLRLGPGERKEQEVRLGSTAPDAPAPAPGTPITYAPPVPTGPPPQPGQPVDPTSPSAASTSLPAGVWIAGAASLVFAGAGVVTFLLADSAYDDIDALCPPNNCQLTSADLQSRIDARHGQLLDTLSAVSFGLAGVAAGLAVVFYVLPSERPTSARAAGITEVSLGPGHLRLEGRF